MLHHYTTPFPAPSPSRSPVRRSRWSCLPSVLSGLLACCWLVAGVAALQAQSPEDGTPETPAEPVVAPEVAFGGEGVAVSGLTPSGEVAVLSVTRQLNASGGTDVLVHDVLATDEDGDGAVEIGLGEIGLGEIAPPVPPLSVWLVVDVATGETVLAWPGGFEPAEATVELTEEPGASAPGRLRLPLGRAELLLVRPGEPGRADGGSGETTAPRVLRASVGDGGDLDGDGARDGAVSIAPPVFARAVGRAGEIGPPAEPPARFEPGDLVLAIDGGDLRVGTFRLPGPPEEPGEPDDPGGGNGGGGSDDGGTGGEG